MPNPSNLYADKVFAEHPISLWSLDDSLEYVSFSSETNNDFSSWNPTNASAAVLADPPELAPNSLDSYVVQAPYSDPATLPFLTYAITATEPVAIAGMDTDKETFTIGSQIYIDNNFPDVISVSIGYYAVNAVTQEGHERIRTYSFPDANQWLHLSDTFLISDIGENELVFPHIKVLIQQPSASLSRPQETLPTTYDIYFSGLRVGQWAENFAFSTTGQIPSTGVANTVYGVGTNQLSIPAKEYGISGSDGYYLTKDYSLLCQNFGIPMVYGASNVTKIKPLEGYPSLIIPGNGFMNDSGRYNEYTAEMWIRIDSSAIGPRRVFGPVASDDGLYIDGPFLKFKIGNEVASHYAGELFRPMLLHIKLSQDSASVLLNSEQIMTLEISSDVSYPAIEENGLQQDWLGFYGYSDVPLIEVDCIAIYPYLVSSLIAKRRFAYGQAVELPENINSAFSGTSAYLDYNFADYTNNYNYPDTGRWSQGSIDNLDTSRSNLSTPSHPLPEIILQSTTYDEWMAANALLQDDDSAFVSFSDSPGYMYFKNFKFLKEGTRAFYMIFDIPELPEQRQILFSVNDNTNDNYFEAVLEDYKVKYILNYGGQQTLLYEQEDIIANSKSFIGIDIRALETYFGRDVSAFFGNKPRLSLYVGSNKNFEHVLDGRIYSVNFCTDKSFNEISGLFQDPEIISSEEFVANAGDSYFGKDPAFWFKTFDGGLVDSFTLSSVDQNFVASYTLRPKSYFGKFTMDILTSSYWEDYIPLKHFAQYVKSDTGSYYDLDFIQFNIDYPNRHIELEDSYDTSNEQVRTYISFQYLQAGANATKSSFSFIEPAPKNSVISPGSNWMTTKYEVTDNSVIYMPPGVNLSEVAIVTHIEIVTDGTESSPIRLKSLEYASQSYNSETSNPIGTRFGLPIYPYKRYGSYYDYKTKNPYRITKKPHPYLYLTRSSGIEKIGDDDPSIERGLSIPVNQNLSESYRVVAMQFAMLYSGDTFGERRQRIMDIESKSSLIRVYLERNDSSGNRARLYAINAKTGQELTSTIFYINGNRTTSPVISVHEWNMIGIRFQNILNLDNYVGSIRVNGPVLVNNISYYQSTNLQELQRQELYSWFNIVNIDPLDPYWSTVLAKLPYWNNVLVKSTVNTYGVSPDDIYKAYVGTNQIILDDNDGITFGGYQYSFYTDVESSVNVYTPV